MRLHQLISNRRFNRFIIRGLVPVSLVAAAIFLMSDSPANPVLAESDETIFVSNQEQNRNGEMELQEDTPVVGQIFTTGGDQDKYELTEITSRFDNTSRTHKFDLKVALHLVTNNKPGSKVVDMTGNLQEHKTNHWSPASITILEPNTKYMIVFRCNTGSNNDQNCNGNGEEIEIKLTDSDAEDSGKSSGWSIANKLYTEDEDGNSSTHWRSARIEVKGRNAEVPYIVDGGVEMYDVNHAEASGWDTRTIGDDTYGDGEFIAVSVEFSAPVHVDNDATFRIQIGSLTKGLVPGRTTGNQVLFVAFIQPYDSDSDGVWIGDNTATLDHNAADAIRSVGDSPRNAALTHASLGTQSNHKVDGSKTRPKVTTVIITSSPQHADAYIRSETIQVEAKFDRPVVVSGDVSAQLTVEAFGSDTTRFAKYASGSGTSTLVLEYSVKFLDNDGDGIAIPPNALARDGDLTMGAQDGGSIKGGNGGLLADLYSSSRGEDTSHRVDARFVAIPEVLTAIQWDWEEDTPSSDSIEMDFSINEDPGHFSEDQVLVLALGWGHIQTTRFAFGLRTDVDKPGTDGSQGKGVIFNRWGTTNTATYGRAEADGWVETGDFGGPFISVRKAYDWGEGDYSVRVAPDDDDDTDGRWYGLWITDKSTNVETKMGSLKFPLLSGGDAPKILARNDVYGSIIALVGSGAINPTEIPVFEASLGMPDASGGDDEPYEITVDYALLHGQITNANVSYDADEHEVVTRVGGSTLRITQPGSTISLGDK